MAPSPALTARTDHTTHTSDAPTLERRRALLGLPLLLFGQGCVATAAPTARPAPPAAPAPLATEADVQVTLQGKLRHWVDLPAGYADDPARRWPLIVFLHGGGERGQRLADVRIHGLPRLLDAGARVPAIVVSPQCESNTDWDPHLLHGLLSSLQARWRIDARRVTATGLSMGGAGCWAWARHYPDDLAGIAPVCGFGRAQRIARMRAVPVRTYHGEDDDIVPAQASRDLVAALRRAGGQAELTLYPGVGHDAWTPAYADPALLPWLLARQRA